MMSALSQIGEENDIRQKTRKKIVENVEKYLQGRMLVHIKNQKRKIIFYKESCKENNYFLKTQKELDKSSKNWGVDRKEKQKCKLKSNYTIIYLKLLQRVFHVDKKYKRIFLILKREPFILAKK